MKKALMGRIEQTFDPESQELSDFLFDLKEPMLTLRTRKTPKNSLVYGFLFILMKNMISSGTTFHQDMSTLLKTHSSPPQKTTNPSPKR